MSIPATVTMKDRAAWRSWLLKNHGKKKEVWLVHARKQGSTDPVSCEEAVGKAISFYRKFGFCPGMTVLVQKIP